MRQVFVANPVHPVNPVREEDEASDRINTIDRIREEDWAQERNPVHPVNPVRRSLTGLACFDRINKIDRIFGKQIFKKEGVPYD